MRERLGQTQRFLTEAVRSQTPIGETASLAADLESLLSPSVRGMSPAERLEVYREQFWLRHLAGLGDDFPTLAWAIGGAAPFRALATEFLAANAPSTWDLQRLGAELPRHVERHPRLGADLVACGAARLDWAFMEVFDAPDAPAFDPTALALRQEDEWPGARVVLHPALRLLELNHPLHEVRAALRAGTPVPPELPAGVVHVAVWRDPACFPRSESLDATAYELLVALQDVPLGLACEEVSTRSGLDQAILSERVGAWFQQWTQRGWVVAVKFPDG